MSTSIAIAITILLLFYFSK